MPTDRNSSRISGDRRVLPRGRPSADGFTRKMMSNHGTARRNEVLAIDKGRATQVRAEVERLLACIAEGADHYRVLDISRDSTVDKVRQAYCQAVEQLHPLKCQDLVEGDGVLRWKLSEVFLRIVEAFSVLSSPGRKVEYDGLLNLRPIKPLPMPNLQAFRRQRDSSAFAESIPDRDNGSKRLGLGSAFGHAELNAPKVADRRGAARLALCLPVRVSSDNNDWQEVTETLDVSRSGVKIPLSHYPQPGTVFFLELPMPLALRSHGFHEGLYVVKAVVRHAVLNEGRYLVGVEFQDDASAPPIPPSQEPFAPNCNLD